MLIQNGSEVARRLEPSRTMKAENGKTRSTAAEIVAILAKEDFSYIEHSWEGEDDDNDNSCIICVGSTGIFMKSLARSVTTQTQTRFAESS